MGKQKWKKAQKCDKLDNETLQYYRRISHELKQEFDDDENKGITVKSVFLHCAAAAHVMM